MRVYITKYWRVNPNWRKNGIYNFGCFKLDKGFYVNTSLIGISIIF